MITCRRQSDTESSCGNTAVRCPDVCVDSTLLQETGSGLEEESVEKRG